ncbi:MAG: hypothetical protein DMF81_18125, partial [Acidobacteria bacterium]
MAERRGHRQGPDRGQEGGRAAGVRRGGRLPGRSRPGHPRHRQRPTGGARQRLPADRRQHPRRADGSGGAAEGAGPDAPRRPAHLEGLRPGRLRLRRHGQRARRHRHGLLAVAVLFVLLRDWRVTLVGSVTLPLTVISTFLFMKLFGERINLMSMGGLAVVIGLVMDDAVVVVENIHRHRARGEGPEAVDKAVAELVAPVVGSTLTTVVVFAPLGLLSGVVGQFFRALSITLSVSVIVSLFLALTLIPLLAQWSRPEKGHEGQGRAMEERYGHALERAMGHPRLLGLGVLGLILAAVVLYRFTPTGFLPKMDEGGFVIDYLTPAGTAIQETDRQIRKVEKLVADTPEVASFSRRTGSELGLFATEPNKGDLLVRLKPRGQRHRSAEAVIEDLRPKIHDAVPSMDVEFVQLLQDMIGDLEGNPTPIEVKIFGDDP